MNYDQTAACTYCGHAITRSAASGASWRATEVNIWRQTLCDGKNNPSSYHYPHEEI